MHGAQFVCGPIDPRHLCLATAPARERPAGPGRRRRVTHSRPPFSSIFNARTAPAAVIRPSEAGIALACSPAGSVRAGVRLRRDTLINTPNPYQYQSTAPPPFRVAPILSVNANAQSPTPGPRALQFAAAGNSSASHVGLRRRGGRGGSDDAAVAVAVAVPHAARRRTIAAVRHCQQRRHRRRPRRASSNGRGAGRRGGVREAMRSACAAGRAMQVRSGMPRTGWRIGFAKAGGRQVAGTGRSGGMGMSPPPRWGGGRHVQGDEGHWERVQYVAAPGPVK
eukprot:364488-Chlamydomonas_euryale.AAC.4